MGQRAVITGATAGIGAEFSQQLAARGVDLLLIARNQERLADLSAQLQREHGVAVEVLSADLSTTDGIKKVKAALANSSVDWLVNNAGFGLDKPFEKNTAQEEQTLLNVLVTAPMQLMHAALPGMLQRGRGRIVNVSSVAAFIPRSTYGAAKAWLLSFSEWAHAHYKPQGITVTALCPGFVRTEFHERMGVSQATVPEWLWLDSPRVVRECLDDVVRGKAVSIPSKRYRALVCLTKALPSDTLATLGTRGRN